MKRKICGLLAAATLVVLTVAPVAGAGQPRIPTASVRALRNSAKLAKWASTLRASTSHGGDRECCTPIHGDSSAGRTGNTPQRGLRLARVLRIDTPGSAGEALSGSQRQR